MAKFIDRVTPKFEYDSSDEVPYISEEVLITLDNMTPKEMLEVCMGVVPTTRQEEVIEEMRDSSEASNGVINIVLQLVLVTNDFRIPKAYAVELAMNYKSHKCTTAKEAYALTCKRLTKKNKIALEEMRLINRKAINNKKQ